jgi:hypothetical protein
MRSHVARQVFGPSFRVGSSEELEGMAVSITNAQPGAGVYVGITFSPADVNIIARAIRSELASEWQEILAAPLPGHEDIVRIRTMLDVYEGQLETLGWGEPQADVEIECPTSQLDVVAQELLGGLEETEYDHRLAVCATVQHLLTEMRGKLEA